MVLPSGWFSPKPDWRVHCHLSGFKHFAIYTYVLRYMYIHTHKHSQLTYKQTDRRIDYWQTNWLIADRQIDWLITDRNTDLLITDKKADWLITDRLTDKLIEYWQTDWLIADRQTDWLITDRQIERQNPIRKNHFFYLKESQTGYFRKKLNKRRKICRKMNTFLRVAVKL